MASDFFADKKYENLDWISQAVEPWEWPVIEELRQLPETIEITPEIMAKNYDAYYGFEWGRHIDTLVSHDAREYAANLYKSESESSDPIIVDFKNNTMSNKLILVKTKATLDDENIKQIAISKISNIAGAYSYDLRDSDQFRRAGDILDLMGANMAETRGARNRGRVLNTTLHTIFAEDRWRIRSMDLVEKIGRWIHDYIREGSVSGMANFAKMKVMTHSGKPIYSITEVE